MMQRGGRQELLCYSMTEVCMFYSSHILHFQVPSFPLQHLDFSEVRLYFISFTNLFSLMIGLPHFDVSNQVSTRASIQEVWHRDHQVVERGALFLFSRV